MQPNGIFLVNIITLSTGTTDEAGSHLQFFVKSRLSRLRTSDSEAGSGQAARICEIATLTLVRLVQFLRVKLERRKKVNN